MNDAINNAVNDAMNHLMWAEIALAALVLGVLPGIYWWRGRAQHESARGLGLPRGSVRSMLAILIVGSTINMLLFGSAQTGDHFGQVMAALTTLSGSVMGFYFGGRTAAPHPPNDAGPRPAPEE